MQAIKKRVKYKKDTLINILSIAKILVTSHFVYHAATYNLKENDYEKMGKTPVSAKPSP